MLKFLFVPARIPQALDRYGFYVDVEEYELGDLNEPPNYKAALSDPEFDKWLEAMNTKMQSMKDNQVWVLVDLPPNGRTVRSKCLFKKKTNMDGNVHTFKARLVAKGYTQTYGVDYGETFSPVADIRAIRILLAIAAFYDYEIWQMDVKTAFLNGHLSEDVYMVQPEGFVDQKHPNKVCKLRRSIYGLNRSNVVFLILYVDDILLMGNNVTMLQEVKSWLCAKTPSEEQRMQRVPYASAIGSIMYAVRCTRPDVSFAQNLCSRFQQNPGEIHWTAIKAILKQIRTIPNPKWDMCSYLMVEDMDWKSAKQSTTLCLLQKLSTLLLLKRQWKSSR
ncbi:retrovirus-related pol polyprotein from transposon TNT 1-94 [Tanacetum coccineum]